MENIMVLNINEAIAKIKAVGPTNVRSVPMPGNTPTGQYQVEVKEGVTWMPIITGLTKRMAEDVIAQATNRVLLG